MRTNEEIMNAILDQVNHWIRIGKIVCIDRETVEEAAEMILTDEELAEAYKGRTSLISHCLMCL